MRTIGFTIAFLAAASMISISQLGCGPADAQAAQSTVDRFMKASESNDQAGVEATLTKKAREMMHGKVDLNNKNSSHEKYTIGEAVIDKDSATVPVTKEGEKESPVKFRLRREDGEWRIYALTVAGLPGGGDFTINFEDPATMVPEIFKAIGFGLGEGMKELGKSLGSGMKSFAEGFQQGLNQSLSKSPDPTPTPDSTGK